MAGLSVGGGGKSGKKAIDAEVPLVPFIDLLLCCVMFLLVSAVWTQLGRVSVNQREPGVDTAADPPAPRLRLVLRVGQEGFVLGSSAGEHVAIARVDGSLDIATLQTRLAARQNLDDPNQIDFLVAPDDGTPYEEVVAAMDAIVGTGYRNLEVGDGATL